MGIFRVYTGEDGHSHVEELRHGDHAALEEALSAREISFHEVPVDFYNGFHTEDVRTVVIVLAGQFAFGFEDGTSHRPGPGDATIFEDFTGSGHDFRVASETPPIAAVIRCE